MERRLLPEPLRTEGPALILLQQNVSILSTNTQTCFPLLNPLWTTEAQQLNTSYSLITANRFMFNTIAVYTYTSDTED